ncbi:hypothetical protein AVEN_130727-1, partial [Araneus ventricosus]
ALTIGVRRLSRSTCKETLRPHIPRISGFIFHALSFKDVCLAGRDAPSVIDIEPPEGVQEEEYEERMSIAEDIPVAATLTGLEICQARPSNTS